MAKVIRFLLDKIDPETNMWTKRAPFFHSRVDIDLERDESEIRAYMTKLKNGSFAEVYPDLVKEWDIEKNGDLTPDKVKPHSDICVWWICPECGLSYSASVGHRSYGYGCRLCGRRKTTRSHLKGVAMIDPITNETIKTFESITEASNELHINSSNISMVCKGQRKKAGGYAWKYLE